MSNTLSCCSQLLRLALSLSLSLSIVRSAILPRALVGKRQGRYKPNKLLLSGGGRKTLRERERERERNKGRKEKTRKERERERGREREGERENNRRDLHCQSPGGEMLGFTCYNLLGNWRFCVKWFLCRGKCTVSVLSELKGDRLIFIWGQRHVPSIRCHPPSPPSLQQQEHSVHSGGGERTGQVWLCNSAAITGLTVSHNELLLKAQFTQITHKKTPPKNPTCRIKPLI